MVEGLRGIICLRIVNHQSEVSFECESVRVSAAFKLGANGGEVHRVLDPGKVTKMDGQVSWRSIDYNISIRTLALVRELGRRVDGRCPMLYGSSTFS